MAIDAVDVDHEAAPPVAFRCHHKALSAALATVGVAVANPSDPPSMSGVLLRGVGDELIVTATNAATFISVRIPGTASPDSSLLIDRRELSKALAAMAKGRGRGETADLPVEISATEVRSPRLTIDGRSLPLVAYDARDFPEIPAPLRLIAEIDRRQFSTAVSRVIVATGRNETPAWTRGVQFKVTDGTVVLAATDRFRLAVAPTAAMISGRSGPLDFVVRCELLDHVVKKFTGAKVQLGWKRKKGDSRLSLSCDGITVVTRLNDDQFPAYDSLVPTTAIGTVRAKRAQLLEATTRAAGIAAVLSQLPTTIELNVSGSALSVIPPFSSRTDMVIAPAMEAEVTGLAEDTRIALEARFLVDALASFTSEHVVLHVNDLTTPQVPIVLTESFDGLTDPSAFRHLVCPMKIKRKDATPTLEIVRADLLRFSCGGQALTAAVQSVGITTDAESPHEALRGVLIEAGSDRITLSGVGGGAFVSVGLPATVEASTITTRVDHSQLSAVIAAIADGRSARELGRMQATISAAESRSPMLHLAGYRVPLRPYDDDPRAHMPEAPPPVAEVDGPLFARNARRVVKVLNTNDTIPSAYSARFDVNVDVLTISGTDRFQLAIARLPASNTVTTDETSAGAWLSGRLLARVVKHVGDGPVRIGWRREKLGTLVSLSFGSTTVVTGATWESGTTLEKLVPCDPDATVTIDRKRLLAEVQRAAALLTAMRVKPSEQRLSLTVLPSGVSVAPYVDDTADDRAAPVLPAEVLGRDETLRIYFRPHLLLNALRNFTGERITLHPHGPKRPMVVTDCPEGLSDRWAFQHVLMPWRQS